MIHDFFKMKTDDKKVSRLIFEETNDLAHYVKKAPISEMFKNERLSSNKKLKDNGFNDFYSFEEATQALEYGTDIYFNTFKKDIKKVENFISQREKHKLANYKNDRVGFIPIVPNAIIGNPINMINQNIKPKPYPTVNIILEKGNSAGVKSEDMCSYYSIIFVLIQLLEKRGIRCEVWVAGTFKEGDELVICKAKIKKYTQPLNIYKIQFPIIASDFLRRIMFRILETNTDIKNFWTFGYGCPLMTDNDFKLRQDGTINERLREVLDIEENDVLIPSCQYFYYHSSDDIDSSLSKIINGTNLNKYIKLEG